MLLKKATYKKVKVLQSQRVTDDVFGCDECKQEIKNFPNESQRLEVKVFKKNGEETDSLHFCSWECVLKHLQKVKCDYFIDLPFMYFDEPKGSKRSGKHLVNLLKKLPK